MKKVIRMVQFWLAVVLCCGTVAVLGGSADAAALPHKLILPDELPLPEGIEGLEDLTVIIVDGSVCVTDRDGNVIYDTTVSSDSLTKADREMLEKGISAADYLKLIRLIESYTS